MKGNSLLASALVAGTASAGVHKMKCVIRRVDDQTKR